MPGQVGSCASARTNGSSSGPARSRRAPACAPRRHAPGPARCSSWRQCGSDRGCGWPGCTARGSPSDKAATCPSRQTRSVRPIPSPIRAKNCSKLATVRSRPIHSRRVHCLFDLVDQRQVFVALGILDLIDADGRDRAQLPVLDAPLHDILDRLADLVPGACGTTPRSPATTASAPSAPGTACRPWSVGACRCPRAPLRPAPRSSGNPPAACSRATPPCSPTAARTRTGAGSGDHSPAPAYDSPSTPVASRGAAAR